MPFCSLMIHRPIFFFLFVCLFRLLIPMYVSPPQDKSTYKNGKAVHTIKVVPRLNLTVTCTVTNKFGEDVRSINVSSGTQMQSELLRGHNTVSN